MKFLYSIGDIILDTYQILEVLGRGGTGVTYKVRNVGNHELIALKVLSIRHLKHSKVLDLFEREARVLAQLDHPQIPRYVDYFQSNQGRNQYFHIAQQLAGGQSLASLIEQGWKPEETEVRSIAEQLLAILIYLQNLAPPVIHRDIKPQNIIRNSHGQIFLVDFGAVQNTYHQTLTGGSTIVGTYGYMAPEQYQRQATLATDLYGLGKTLIFLLTQTHPSHLPSYQSGTELSSIIQVSPFFSNWLNCLTQPSILDRFASAKEALAVLGEKQFGCHFHLPNQKQLSKSPVKLRHHQETLIIEVPSSLLRISFLKNLLVVILFFGFALIFPFFIDSFYHFIAQNFLDDVDFMLYLPFRSISSNSSWSGYYLLVLLLMMGTLVFRLFLSASFKTYLSINSTHFRLIRWLFGSPFRVIRGKTSELKQAELEKIRILVLNLPITICVIKTNTHCYRFGTFLSHSEKHGLLTKSESLFLAGIGSLRKEI